MIIRGLTAGQIGEAATDTGVRLVNFRSKGRGHAFTLGLEGELWRRRSDSGRKVAAVCYHGHAAFMQRVFDYDQKAIIITAMERYNGRSEFQEKACAVGARGSTPYRPQTYGELCDCTGEQLQAVV